MINVSHRYILSYLPLCVLLVLTGCTFNDEASPGRSYTTHNTGGLLTPKIRGSGNLVTVDRSDTLKSAHLSAIVLAGIGTLSLEEGEPERFEVVAEDNIADKVSTEVVDGALTCQLRTGFSYELYHPQGVEYRLTLNKQRLQALRLIQMGGAAKVNAEASWEGGEMTFEAQGASRMALNQVSASALRINVEGAARIEAKRIAAAKACSIVAAGASLVDIEQLDAADAHCVIKAQGSSKVDIAAGSMRSCEVEAQGAAALRAYRIKCAEKPTVVMQGAASVHLDGTKYHKK